MFEEFPEPEEELKRADHLVFVTLKYTRTTDVIKNAIKRLINACDLITREALYHAHKKKKLKAIPTNVKSQQETLLKVIKKKEIKDFVDFYKLLRKIDVSGYSSKSEYRKHVTLIAHLEKNKNYEVDVDRLLQFYERTKSYVEYIRAWMQGK